MLGRSRKLLYTSFLANTEVFVVVATLQPEIRLCPQAKHPLNSSLQKIKDLDALEFFVASCPRVCKHSFVNRLCFKYKVWQFNVKILFHVRLFKEF